MLKLGPLFAVTCILPGVLLTGCSGGEDAAPGGSQPGPVEEQAQAGSDAWVDQEGQRQSGPETAPDAWNFLRSLCIVESGTLDTCSSEEANAALGASVDPVVYLYFDADSAVNYVVGNNLNPGVSANPVDGNWPEGTYYPQVMADASYPATYQPGDHGAVLAEVVVAQDCSVTSKYRMLDGVLYAGESSVSAGCDDFRKGVTERINRVIQEQGVQLPGDQDGRYTPKKYIARNADERYDAELPPGHNPGH